MVNNRYGFTLIELIIVISIILFFSGLSLTYFGNYIEQSKLKTEAVRFRDALELAKKKTLAREIIGNCTENFTGYKININQNGYNLLFCCDNNCDQNNPLISAKVNLQSNSISIIPTTASIQFIPSPKGTDLENDLTITLKNSAINPPNQCLKITVTKIGIVSLDDKFTNCQ